MIKIPYIIASLAFVLGLSPTIQATEEKETKKAYIPLISKGSSQRVWQLVRVGAEQAATDFDVNISFEGPENEGMVDKQVEMLAAVLAKNPNAICFAALDTDDALPLLKKAHAENIPIIAFDSGIDSHIPVTTVTTNNRAAGAFAADQMAHLIGNKGDVAIVAHDHTSRSGIDRRDGFVHRIQTAHPHIKVVSIEYSASEPSQATIVTKSMLQAHPHLKGMFATNEGSAVGMLSGVKEMKRKLILIGFDSGKQQKEAILDGTMAGAITQNPIRMGYKTVDAAVKAIRGEHVPKVIDIGFYWYDKNNMDNPQIYSVLYD